MCSDRNIAAIAIAWSARCRLREALPKSMSASNCFSAPMQMRAIASTARTGKLPAAVSADSITASVPSITALATSSTSARVGIGLSTIDCSIWVAVITTRLRASDSRMIFFCRPGSSASPISTPRSPRATITTSLASTISDRFSIASARSIFDTGGMIGGIVTGLDEFLIRGGDGKDTISGDALASGKTGIAEDNNKATTAATLEGGEGFAAYSAGNDVIDRGDGENLLDGDAMASNAQGGNATATRTADTKE